MARSFYSCLVWAVAVGVAATSAVAKSPEELLPDTTRGFFSITKATQLTEQWKKTQLGQLMADPAMEAFSKDLQHQFEDRLATLRDRLGLTLEDLRGVPSGEVAVGALQLEGNVPAVVILMDCGGRLDKAKSMLEKTTKHQLDRGAKQRSVEAGGVKITIFDLPKPPDEPNAITQAAYFLVDNQLGASDNADALQGVAARLHGKSGKTLADDVGFQQVMARCQKDAGKDVPLMRWWIQPLGYAEVVRAATPEQNRRKGKTATQLMRNQGFTALQGVGGFVDLKAGPFEVLHRTAIYAPQPYTKSMKMLVFPNASEFKPQPWVPADISAYATFQIDIQNAFKNFGTLFDELFGEGGETGIWKDVLQSFIDDPNGPRLDLEKDLIAKLGKRITILTSYKLPIAVDSERTLYAVEAVDEKAVAAAISKWMGNDPTAKARKFKGHVIWEMVEPEVHEMPVVNLEAIPSISPTPEQKKGPRGRAAREEEEEGQRLLPHAAVTVTNGHLLVASHMDFLQKILEQADGKRLADDVDFQRAVAEVQKNNAADRCGLAFSRTDEEYRPTYELIRQNKMPQSETTIARVLNAMGGEVKKGAPRKQRLDGSKLPDYETVRRYLGSAGGTALSEKDGWFIKGFTLTKESGKAAAKEPVKEPAKPAAKQPAKEPAKAATPEAKTSPKAPAKPAAKPAPKKAEKADK